MRDSFVNLTSSGQVCAGGCVLDSMYVNSTSSGVIYLFNGSSTNAAASNLPIGGIITPAAGFHFLGNLDATNGVYFGKQSGTIDVTFHLRNRDN